MGGLSPFAVRWQSPAVMAGTSAITVHGCASTSLGTAAFLSISTVPERGATQALPFTQQLFKRRDGGRITLATAATSNSSSNQKLDFSQLIETYQEFVPNAGDKTWEGFCLPVLRNCAKAFAIRTPLNGEALPMQCLDASSNGKKAHGCARRAVRSSMASSTGWCIVIDTNILCTAPPCSAS